MIHRFHVPSGAVKDGKLIFSAETAHQIVRVLRLGNGDEAEVIDGSGKIHRVRLATVEGAMQGQVLSTAEAETEAILQVTLYVSLTQREKFEWILQKATELGVAGIAPIISSRSLVQEKKGMSARLQRWQKIMQEATEQSRRALVPVLLSVMSFEEALHDCQQRCECGVLAAPVAQLPLSQWQVPARSCAVFIGPEGGFSDQEIDSATYKGLTVISLGKRILRMETAAIAALTMLLFKSGDLG